MVVYSQEPGQLSRSWIENPLYNGAEAAGDRILHESTFSLALVKLCKSDGVVSNSHTNTIDDEVAQ